MPPYHPIDALFDLKRALEASLESDWPRSGTAGTGSFPPAMSSSKATGWSPSWKCRVSTKDDLDIRAKDYAIRISGKKEIAYPQSVSVHRRERLRGTFDRTLTVPMQVGTDARDDGAARAHVPATDIFETDAVLTIVVEMPDGEKQPRRQRRGGILELWGRFNFDTYEGLQPVYTGDNIGHYHRGFSRSPTRSSKPK